MKTLIWKELRETARWIPIGLAIASMACYLGLPYKSNWMESVDVASTLATQICLISIPCALALGALQSVFDLRASAQIYLNHRAVSASQIILAKLAAGFLVYAVSLATPLAMTSVWLNARGLQDMPVRPAQVLPALVVSLACFAFHPAAMVMLTRQAAWFGTRIIPLALAMVTVPVMSVILSRGGMWGVQRVLPFTLLLVAFYVWCAHQAWCKLAAETEKPSLMRAGWSLRVLLTSCSLMVVVLIALLGLIAPEFFQSHNRTLAPHELARPVMDATTGDAWMLLTEQSSRYQAAQDRSPSGRAVRLQDGMHVERLSFREPLPEAMAIRAFSNLQPIEANSPYHGDGFFHFLGYSVPRFAQGAVYDARGYWLQYSTHELIGIVDREGWHHPDRLPSRPFTSNPIPLYVTSYVNGETNRFSITGDLFATQEGLTQLNEYETHTLIDEPIAWFTDIQEGPHNSVQLVIGTRDAMKIYSFLDKATNEPLQFTSILESLSGRSGSVLGEIAARLDQTIPTNELAPADLMGQLAIHERGCTLWSQDGVVKLFHDGTVERMELVPAGNSIASSNQAIQLGFFPPVFLAAAEGIARWIGHPGGILGRTPETLSLVAMGSVVTVFGAMVTTWWLGGRRGLTTAQHVGWLLACLPLGLAAPLTLIVFSPTAVTDTCPKCQQATRVDRATCQHCGASLETDPSPGIRLVDSEWIAEPVAALG